VRGLNFLDVSRSEMRSWFDPFASLDEWVGFAVWLCSEQSGTRSSLAAATKPLRSRRRPATARGSAPGRRRRRRPAARRTGAVWGNGPYNLAVLRHMALNVMQKDGEKGSLCGKLKRAGWDQAYLAQLLILF
jgi:hypothetical protein